jgi:quercetin dioxygenase-like cupin family protein
MTTSEQVLRQAMKIRQREDDMEQAPYVVAGGEGEALWFFGMLVLFKATGEQTGGRFCLTEQHARRGPATPLHRQPADDESFVVLEGQLRFYLGDGDAIMAGPGATDYVPAGAAHAFAVVSETARLLNLTTPNHEAFFRAAGEPALERVLPPDAPPDMAKVVTAAARFGVEILGPPPGGA